MLLSLLESYPKFAGKVSCKALPPALISVNSSVSCDTLLFVVEFSASVKLFSFRQFQVAVCKVVIFFSCVSG